MHTTWGINNCSNYNGYKDASLIGGAHTNLVLPHIHLLYTESTSPQFLHEVKKQEPTRRLQAEQKVKEKTF